jgi:malate/lactate dehydrogenase
MTVSAPLDGQYGLSGVTLGVPCIVGANGIERILDIPLPPAELASLRRSAETLQTILADLESASSP